MTSAEAIQVIYNCLRAALIQNHITGGIYPLQRPHGSDKEDVVINCLGMPNQQLQRSVINVNVFVPLLSVTIDGIPQQQPDTKRMGELLDILLPVLKGRQRNYWFEYQQHRIADTKDFINIRVDFFSVI